MAPYTPYMDLTPVTISALLAALGSYLVLSQTRAGGLLPLRAPGILVHELAHWLVAQVTRSAPSPIRIPWRKDKEGGVTYAQVEFTPGFFTAGLVAMAPLIAMPWVAIFLIQGGPLPAIAAGSVLAHGYPSKADWQVLLSRPASWPFSILAVAASYIEWWNIWIAG